MKINFVKEDSNDCKEVKVVNTGGISFMGLLTVALVVLKAMGYISISWWWVFAPIWIPVLIALFVIVGCVGLMFISYKDLLCDENLSNIPNDKKSDIAEDFTTTNTNDVEDKSGDSSTVNIESENEVKINEKIKHKTRKKKTKKEVTNELPDTTTKRNINK